MGFPTSVADEVLVHCGRHCCICGKFVGTKIELHHIIQVADGGDDSVDNCIPLCLDCHAEVKSYNPKHPKGRKYTETELKRHRDKCYEKYALEKNFAKIDEDETKKTIFVSNKPEIAVTWGYSDQDLVCPLFPGSLVLIAGYTQSLKSTYVQHIVNWNLKHGQRVAYCCLKNHPAQVSLDIIAEAAHINANKTKLAMLTEEEWKCVEKVRNEIPGENLALFPYDKASSCDEIISLVETSGADMVVIDDVNGIIFDENNSVEQFFYKLKNAAGRSDVMVFCIYNLSLPRARFDMRPMLSDFPSENFHRLFDVVQMLFRPELYYGKDYEENDILEVINLKGALRNPCTFKMAVPKNITGVFSIVKNK